MSLSTGGVPEKVEKEANQSKSKEQTWKLHKSKTDGVFTWQSSSPSSSTPASTTVNTTSLKEKRQNIEQQVFFSRKGKVSANNGFLSHHVM